MAKKKQSKSATNEKPLSKLQDDPLTAAVDSDASEKLDNLRSLNQMLLQETLERRQQVESLLQSNDYLESELDRSNLEKEALVSELSSLGEMAARLEIERIVESVFVSVQVGEVGEVVELEIKGLEMEVRRLKGVIDGKGSEIAVLSRKVTEIECVLGNEREVSRRVCVERDELKDRLDVQIAESMRLRGNVTELEEMKREIEREMSELNFAYRRVVVEKECKERVIECALRDKDCLESRVEKLEEELNETREELVRVVREKDAIEEAKNAEVVELRELEDAVSELRETMVALQEEVHKLRAYVVEMGGKFVEGEQKEKVMRVEINRLVEMKNVSEKRVEELIDEKTVLEKNLGEVMSQLDGERKELEGMVNEKIGLLETKGRLDCEVVSLQKELAELKAVILRLEESGQTSVDKIKSLESEVENYACKLKDVKAERDESRSSLEEEKQNVVQLKALIGNMEKNINESIKIAGEMKAENGAMLVEKTNLEGQCESLKKDISSLENALGEARNEINSMKGKVKVADATSEIVLQLLKDTTSLFTKDEDIKHSEMSGVQINGEETKQYVMEFGMIENAIKSKDAKIDGMKKQLEFLQNSVEEAHKKKSFWTVLSSATTVVAGVSLAYIAQGY